MVCAVGALLLTGGCRGFFALGPREPVATPSAEPGRATVRTRETTPAAPVTPPVAVDPIIAEPPDPEPDPAASDSAGVARLVRLAHLWHSVSLHHPAVATRGVPWDSALIIATLRVRSAQNDEALSSAYRRMLALLRDPATRLETTDATDPASTSITTEFTDDSVMVVRIPTTASLDTADSVLVAAAVLRLPSRVLLDLRGSAVRDPAARAARLDAFLSRVGLTAALLVGNATGPVERTRRIGTWAAADQLNDPAVLHDGWQQPTARLYRGRATASRRVLLLADSGTVLPGGLLALHDAGGASLLADGALRDAAPVSRARVPLSAGLVAVVRTGELVHGDGSIGVLADTVIARSTSSADDLARQAALTMLRGSSKLPLAPRPLPVLVPPAATPVFYDTTSYPFMGARLLGGFRMFSAMRARHAHRDLYDDDLDAVFERVIPRLEAARTAEEYAKGLADLAASLDDPEGRLTGASAEQVIGAAAVPFRVRAAEGRVFITDVVRDSMTSALALTPGAEITAFDGYPTVAWISEHRRAQPASNEWSRLRAITQQMSRGSAGDVVVKLRDVSNRDRTVTVPRTLGHRAALPTVERPGGDVVRQLAAGIMYLDVERLSDETLTASWPTVLAARGLVLDLRGTLHIDDVGLLRRLASRPQVATGRVVQRTLVAPCAAPIREATVACADARESRGWQRTVDTSAVYAGRVVVLIDERTQGAMERFALSLEQMADVTLIGSASAGAVSWTTPLSLPGGLQVGIATQELRRTDGGQVQRVGLAPLIEVRPTARGLRSGDDEVLTRAQQWLQQQLDPPTRRRR
jgi:Peptidase family S41